MREVNERCVLTSTQHMQSSSTCLYNIVYSVTSIISQVTAEIRSECDWQMGGKAGMERERHVMMLYSSAVLLPSR